MNLRQLCMDAVCKHVYVIPNIHKEHSTKMDGQLSLYTVQFVHTHTSVLLLYLEHHSGVTGLNTAC